MKTTNYHLYLTHDEYIHTIKALLNLKNALIQQGKYSDAVDDLLFKFSHARKKRMRIETV